MTADRLREAGALCRLVLVPFLVAALVRCGPGERDTASKTDKGRTPVPRAAARTLRIPAPAPLPATTATAAQQRAFMRKSARAAWSYVAREVTSAGFVGATENYQFLTVWDMSSTLAAAYASRELGILSQGSYYRFIRRTLASIARLRLVDGVAFNRIYAARTGDMVDARTAPTTVGMGWSALDHGRLLIWLKLIAQRDSDLAPLADSIVARLGMSRLVRDGYMRGEAIGETGARRNYQEGRVGYEQYAAEGFALWGVKVDSAFDFAVNGRPFPLNGQTLVTDARGDDVMTSEPFVLMGLELGWTTDTWRNLAMGVLSAQEARFRQNGILTMVSEDAIPEPPSYFYYYLLFRDGRPFVVATVSGTVSDSFPRWVSAKAAFGYHALAPGDYTWRALQAVKWGGSSEGWTAGVYEGTKRSTRTYNLNTAAIVLESAAYIGRGCAFIQIVCPRK